VVLLGVVAPLIPGAAVLKLQYRAAASGAVPKLSVERGPIGLIRRP